MFEKNCRVQTPEGYREYPCSQIGDTSLCIIKPPDHGYLVVHDLSGLTLFSNVKVESVESLTAYAESFWNALTEPQREVWLNSKSEAELTDNVSENALKILEKGCK